MKRCPQCEFIYEDDQSLCDMDGALLVFDSRTLPNLHALAPVEVPFPAKAHWRHRTFPAMAALILASVFSLVYFVSTQRHSYSPAPSPASTASSPAPVSDTSVNAPAVTPISTDKPQDANPSSPTTEASAAPDVKTHSDKPTTTAKRSSVKPSTTESKPAGEPKKEQKEDSKVESILKKTGRILKKPFKL